MPVIKCGLIFDERLNVDKSTNWICPLGQSVTLSRLGSLLMQKMMATVQPFYLEKNEQSSLCVAWLCLSCSVFVNYSPINYFTYLGKNQAIGDILVLCGAIMYGISNVAQEFVVKNFSRVEFLGMLGFFGTIISAIQM